MKINLLAIWKKDDDFYHYHGTIVRVCVCVWGGGVGICWGISPNTSGLLVSFIPMVNCVNYSPCSCNSSSTTFATYIFHEHKLIINYHNTEQ